MGISNFSNHPRFKHLKHISIEDYLFVFQSINILCYVGFFSELNLIKLRDQINER